MLDPILDTILIQASIMILISAIVIIIVMRKYLREKTVEPTLSHASQATTNIDDLVKTVQKLQLEKENLTRALRMYESKPSGKVGLIVLSFGAIALVSSTISTSSILALIGLGLTFWGALFLFIRPVRYVKRDILDFTITPSLKTIDRILSDLNYQGNGIYLPPRCLKGLKEGVVFIPAEKETVVPAIEKASQGKVFITPHGMYLIPLGQGLVNLFEKELGTDLFKTDLDYLQNNLPKLLIEGLELVKDFEMSVNGNMVHIRMTGSVYSNLCSEVRKLTNICPRMGCPMCSAIAYALVKVTGRAVTIEKIEFHPNDTVETWYRLIEG